MKKLNLIRRQVIELRQRRPWRTFMGCWERIHEHGNPQWEFDFIAKPNSRRAKAVMISSQPARWIYGKKTEAAFCSNMERARSIRMRC